MGQKYELKLIITVQIKRNLNKYVEYIAISRFFSVEKGQA